MRYQLIGAIVGSLSYPSIAALAAVALGICWILRKRRTVLLAIFCGLLLGWHYLYVKLPRDLVARQMAEEQEWWRLNHLYR